MWASPFPRIGYIWRCQDRNRTAFRGGRNGLSYSRLSSLAYSFEKWLGLGGGSLSPIPCPAREAVHLLSYLFHQMLPSTRFSWHSSFVSHLPHPVALAAWPSSIRRLVQRNGAHAKRLPKRRHATCAAVCHRTRHYLIFLKKYCNKIPYTLCTSTTSL
jgi:hypothetical protein